MDLAPIENSTDALAFVEFVGWEGLPAGREGLDSDGQAFALRVSKTVDPLAQDATLRVVFPVGTKTGRVSMLLRKAMREIQDGTWPQDDVLSDPEGKKADPSRGEAVARALTLVPFSGTLVSAGNFVDNFERLLGVHHLTARQASQVTGIAESTLSKWSKGKRSPSLELALTVGEFFGIEPGRLVRASFDELLAKELADSERFRSVEEKIGRIRDTFPGGTVIDMPGIKAGHGSTGGRSDDR